MLTGAKVARSHPLQGVLNARQFAALDLCQLRIDLVLSRVEGEVDHVARRLLAELLKQTQITREGLAQCVAPDHKNLANLQDRIFACHVATFDRSTAGGDEGSAPLRPGAQPIDGNSK